MAEPWDIRLGDFTYRIAHLGDSTLSIYSSRISSRVWQSLLANQATPSGKPSIENIRNDDLRWFVDSFSGGEGQVVLKAGDAVGDSRYARSVGVDLSSPGQFTLAKEMAQVGLTGAAGTTNEADTFTDVTGTSTVSGTDRRLNAVGDIIKKNISPAAGNWQADFYAKVNAAGAIDGSNFAVDSGTAPVSGSTRILQRDAIVSYDTAALDAGGKVTVTFTLEVTDTTGLEGTPFFFHLIVRDHADTKTLAESGTLLLDSSDGEKTRSVTFTGVNGTQYLYRIKASPADTYENARLHLKSVATAISDTKTARISIYNETSATTIATANIDMEGVTSFQRIGTLSFTSDGTSTYSLRFKRQAGASRSQWLDKTIRTPISLNTSWNVELGQNNKIWLFDRGVGVQPGSFTWDAQNKKWVSVGRIAGTGNTAPVALAHSDYYEYVVLGSGQVYYCREPSTMLQYTNAYTNAVGIAVGANRLYVLTEDTTGTNLYEIAVDDTAAAPIAVPGSATYAVGGPTSKAKFAPDATITRRMVGTQEGVAFYTSHGPVATLYKYVSGGAGAPVTDFPPGFKPTSIAYSLGLVYVGGGFPAVDTDGVTRNRPAVFVVDIGSGGAPVQLDAALHRTTDGGSRVIDMQLYGSDLWVMTQITPTSGNKRMRCWRVSLTAAGGTFLTQEVETDESMQTADARAMAVNWRDKVLVFGSANGAPYVEQDTYITSGSVYLESSVFDFALTESKLLLAMQVQGEFPTGTTADLYYSTDSGATWTLAGTRDSAGSVDISDIDSSVPFRRLAMRCVPRTTDNTITPTINGFSSRAYLIEYAKTWDVLLDCRGETATFHISGRQFKGSELAANLFSLADSGSLVEMADRISSVRPEDEEVHRVVVTDPDAVFLDKGESVVRVKLVER